MNSVKDYWENFRDEVVGEDLYNSMTEQAQSNIENAFFAGALVMMSHPNREDIADDIVKECLDHAVHQLPGGNNK